MGMGVFWDSVYSIQLHQFFQNNQKIGRLIVHTSSPLTAIFWENSHHNSSFIQVDTILVEFEQIVTLSHLILQVSSFSHTKISCCVSCAIQAPIPLVASRHDTLSSPCILVQEKVLRAVLQVLCSTARRDKRNTYVTTTATSSSRRARQAQ